MMDHGLIAPVVALAAWSLIVLVWLYATRIPAIRKNKVALDPYQSKEQFNAQLPAKVRWKADNYNHLLEQPTLFYAVALTLAFLGEGSGLNAGLAWLYVGLRIIHSLIQATVNIIILRFSVFTAASLILLLMTIRAAVVIF